MMKPEFAALVLFWMTISLQYVEVSGNRCTAVLSRNEIHEVNKQTPCVQKYEARCGWLSLNYCTFYRQTLCDKRVNETIKTYYIKTDCCSGFVLARNGSCIKKTPGLDLVKLMPPPVTEDPDFVRSSVDKKKAPDSDKPLISGGGYAGIICGAVLLVTVIWFIVIAVKKRRRKKNQKAAPPQTVLYVPTPPLGMVNSNSTHSQLSVLRRETTSLSSQIRTPPASPTRVAEITIPVEQSSTYPFIAKSSPVEIGPSPTGTSDSPLVITVRKGKTEDADKNHSPLHQVTETSPGHSPDLDDICEEQLESLSMGTGASPDDMPLISECGLGELQNNTANTRMSPEQKPLVSESEHVNTDDEHISDFPTSINKLSPEKIPLISEIDGEHLEKDKPLNPQAPPLDLQATPLEPQTSPTVSQTPPPTSKTPPPIPQAPPTSHEGHLEEDDEELPDNEDTPLVFSVENLNDENLPESDI